ncbi:MAG: hypothetical protein ISS72_06465 [Candidatus Brocadiae bacterium]|nr:hypothetical protein [Candidatus Brocadiia bacterium]
MGNRVSLALVAAAIAVLLAVSCRGPEPADENPMGPNAACYVCHMTFVRESLSRDHLAAKVYCINCHGLSAPHANDEDVGATKPDVTFTRTQVNPSCRACHASHDAAPEKVLLRWQQVVKAKFAGQPPASPACTDCHGYHKVAKAR